MFVVISYKLLSQGKVQDMHGVFAYFEAKQVLFNLQSDKRSSNIRFIRYSTYDKAKQACDKLREAA